MNQPMVCPVPTVRVVSEGAAGGFVRINAADFDQDKHVLFDDMPPMPPTDQAKPVRK